MADFFCLANSQVAKEVQRFGDWVGSIFMPDYTLIAVTDEPEAQEARLRYCMSQGTKENLCPGPTSWPGLQSATALINGSMEIVGKWIHRSELYEKTWLYQRTASLKAANRKHNRGLPANQRKGFRGKSRKRPKIKDHTEMISLTFWPIPCWDGLFDKEIQARSKAMAESVQEEHQEKIEKLPKDWRQRLKDQSRFAQRPRKRRPPSVRPKVHAASKEEWIIWIKGWETWITLFDRASARLRRGIKEALDEFPKGAFIPTGIYLSAEDARPPP